MVWVLNDEMVIVLPDSHLSQPKRGFCFAIARAEEVKRFLSAPEKLNQIASAIDWVEGIVKVKPCQASIGTGQEEKFLLLGHPVDSLCVFDVRKLTYKTNYPSRLQKQAA